MVRRLVFSSLWLALGCGGGQAPAEAPRTGAAEVHGEGAAAPRSEGDGGDPREPAARTGAEDGPAGPRAEPPDEGPAGPEPPRGSLELLLHWGLEAREYATPIPAPSEATAGCAPFQGTGDPGFDWYWQCQIQQTLARTARGWLALQVDRYDGEIHELHLFEGDDRRIRERVGGEPTPRRVEAVRSVLDGRGVRPVDDIIGRAVVADFSLGSFHPLVELEGSGWLL